MATNCCSCPTVRFALAGVTTTWLTVGGAFTVIDAVPVFPPPVTVIVAVPTPAAVAVTAAPVVAERLAIDPLLVPQVSATVGIGLFAASKACAVMLTVAPVFTVEVAGAT